jgi:hypothetical protein
MAPTRTNKNRSLRPNHSATAIPAANNSANNGEIGISTVVSTGTRKLPVRNILISRARIAPIDRSG